MRPIVTRVRQSISRFLPSDGFGRHVAVMGGGTAAVQAIGLIAAPILTRLYGPSEFGVMAAFSAVTEILILIATLRYDAAIPIAIEDRDGVKLLALSALSVVAVSAAVLVLLFVLPASIFRLLSADERFYSFRWFLVVAVLGGALYACLTGWVTRRRHFLLLSKSRALQSFSSVGVQLGAGALGAGFTGLMLGAISNLTSGIWMLWKQTARDLAGIEAPVTSAGLRAMAREYRNYPAFSLWTSLVNTLSRSAPTMVISGLYGATATGFYAVGLRIVGMPSALISGSVSNVFLSRVAESTKAGSLGALMEDVTAKLSGISAYIFCTLAVFGPDLFQLVLGAKWADAGQYVRFLSPWLFLSFVFSPQTSVVLARGRQAADAMWQIPILGFRVLALYVGTVLGGGPLRAVVMFGVVSTLLAGAYYGWALRIGGASLRRVGARLATDLGLAATLLGGGRLLFVLADRSAVVMVCVISATGLLLQRRMLAGWRARDVQAG